MAKGSRFLHINTSDWVICRIKKNSGVTDYTFGFCERVQICPEKNCVKLHKALITKLVSTVLETYTASSSASPKRILMHLISI